MIFLSYAERAQLRIHYGRERDGRARDGIKAVLLYDKRRAVAAIAEALPLSEDAIREHNSRLKLKSHLLTYAKVPGIRR